MMTKSSKKNAINAGKALISYLETNAQVRKNKFSILVQWSYLSVMIEERKEEIMTEMRQYTAGEKFANVFTHSVAVLLSIYGIFVLEANSKTALQALSTAIFGATLVLLFLSSVSYHAVVSEKARTFFQKIDHSAIYLLIAGTYTPALVITVRFPLSVVLLLIIWVLAIAGIVFSGIKIKQKYLSTGLYLFMGWLSVFFIYSVWTTSHLSVWLMLVGGLFYSVGCVFYLNKSRYTHFVWHLFVIAGALTHYFAIMELLHAVN
jgi:hemolysin III